ncbi:TPA: hypothetical protein MIR18_28485 [Klebsiella pneumoniae]|nr:hypothetical protein [Salmonella enterica]EBX5210398.1 hypothetical protein [Salmonella enterica subsp. enterica serovar Weltevreden]EBZ8252769.1 hypothetical protein [Salmonella enterica subsp. enterica serovar Enteritidis]ECE9086074.1 hypothetical protein [Salmonella enterica subsp. enterica serovar Corvallis]EEV5801124.1 hypothetical protein [Escherichia coli]HBY1916711.1 hypothetical protein [Klebsiella pneumoniae]
MNLITDITYATRTHKKSCQGQLFLFVIFLIDRKVSKNVVSETKKPPGKVVFRRFIKPASL